MEQNDTGAFWSLSLMNVIAECFACRPVSQKHFLDRVQVHAQRLLLEHSHSCLSGIFHALRILRERSLLHWRLVAARIELSSK